MVLENGVFNYLLESHNLCAILKDLRIIVFKGPCLILGQQAFSNLVCPGTPVHINHLVTNTSLIFIQKKHNEKP